MPVELRVVQCFECKIYQVDFVKKAKKWSCKVCNAKQSVRREHFRGSGPRCRQRVQELNRQQEQIDQSDFKLALQIAESFENKSAAELPSIQSINQVENKPPNYADADKISINANLSNQFQIKPSNIDNPVCFQNANKWTYPSSQQSCNKRSIEENNKGKNKKASKWDVYI